MALRRKHPVSGLFRSKDALDEAASCICWTYRRGEVSHVLSCLKCLFLLRSHACLEIRVSNFGVGVEKWLPILELGWERNLLAGGAGDTAWRNFLQELNKGSCLVTDAVGVPVYTAVPF